jgi:predicted transcriptional regulator
MSTTTVRIPDDLKARAAAVARRAGTTPHKLILAAIAERVEREERRGDFHAEAERRLADIVATGKTISWANMRRYLDAVAIGKRPRRPSAKSLAR